MEDINKFALMKGMLIALAWLGVACGIIFEIRITKT
jgi:hypothetical protein